MMLGTGVERYSRGAILLHWLIALLLAGEIALGFAMPRDASGFALYQLHKSIGITILVLTLVRLGWRHARPRPAKLEGGINGMLASGVHVLFYLFMIAAPLTGWAIVSTASIDVPTLLFGTIPWPHLPLPGSLNEPVEEVHELLAFLGIALFVLHVAGALRHHFLLRDGLLRRMAPGGSPGAALALMLAVVVVGLAVLLGVGGRNSGEIAGEETAAIAAVAGAEAGEAVAGDEILPEEDGAATDAAADEAVEEEAVAEAEEAPAAAPEPAGPPPSWAIRPGGSLRFSVDNGGSALRGSFSRWNGRIVMDPENPQTAEIAIDVELASATLGDATQDQMLQGADFFATASNPTATFRSRSVERTGTNSYRAAGTLTMKGASHPQAITFTLSGSGASRSVSGSGTINRTAFSVGTGSNAANLGGSVSIDFAFDAARQ